ncbi:FAD-dependent oxidoreductase [Exiguobacterium sp. s193]|uniref:NAD(P)/FAD-dependent oxidoreductase n=1 Tax=Exiguobacterium sp. s193 TaxID=2751207 RepID=UPI001BE72334|nr:FAD-dependent oxidoreductase [Exiguobacterium sp. s193]
MKATETLIIGGGVIGLSIAYELLKRGQPVHVLEQNRSGEGATRAAAGMLATDHELIPDLHQLAAASRQLYPHLVRELFNETGIDSGYKENPFRMKTADRDVTFASVGQLDPVQLTRSLRQAIVTRGGQIEEQTTVTGLLQSQATVSGVETTRGKRQARHVVIASGRGSEALLATSGVCIRTVPVKGECLAVRLPGHVLTETLFSDDVYLVPKFDGRIIIGATERPGDETTTVSVGGIAQLLQSAIRLFPAIEEAEIVQIWSGIRPQTADGLPYIGPVSGIERLFVATGHHRHGILLAPVTAALIADYVTGSVSTVESGAVALTESRRNKHGAHH